MGNIVANRLSGAHSLAMAFLVLGVLVARPALAGGGGSKAAADSLKPPPVNRLNGGRPGITALPNELQVNILANLPIRDLLVCKHVCTHWRTLVTTMPALACAAYRNGHPAGYVPDFNNTITSYRGAIRQWLNNFSEPGSRAVIRLDRLLATGAPHFPEQLFFAVACVLDDAPAFDCRKVCTIGQPAPIYSASFSPDEQHLLSCARESVHIHSFVDGRWQDIDILRQTDSILHADFSPDSKYLTVCPTNGRTTTWAYADGQWQQQADNYPPVMRLFPRFNADTSYLMTASVDNYAQIYRLIDGQWLPQDTALDQYPVQSGRFHPKEPDLLATYSHNTVTLWCSVNGQWQQTGTLEHPHKVSGILFSPDGNRLLTYSYSERPPLPGGQVAEANIHIWHRVDREWREEKTFVSPNTRPVALFSPRGHYISVTNGQRQGSLEIWRLSHGQRQHMKISLPEDICLDYFSPDEHYLAIQKWKSGAIICRCLDGLLQEDAVIPEASPFHGIGFSPHGNHFVAARDTKTATIWGVFAGRWQEKATLCHTSPLHTICFSPHGSHILTTTLDGTVTIWSLNSQL